jgi:DNA polymerase-3 subunit delta'
VSIIPLFGHASVWARLATAATRGTLPASLLLHGPAGIGKQRLALRLTQHLLCAGDQPPCGTCQHCRYMDALTHPDLHWIFPRPRLKDSSPDADDVSADYAAALAERADAHGLYAAPSGSEGIYTATVHAMIRHAAITPAMATRKVFLVGDAERMVPQAGADEAANAFLKLLEEPPANTFIILTSSRPTGLLPTIRSRVVSVRLARLATADVQAFVQHDLVRAHLDEMGVARGLDTRVELAQGAPGALLSQQASGDALARATHLLDAALGGHRADLFQAAFVQGATGARGGFSDALDAMTLLLARRARAELERGNEAAALHAASAVSAVARARRQSASNANPQLVAFTLLSELEGVLR